MEFPGFDNLPEVSRWLTMVVSTYVVTGLKDRVRDSVTDKICEKATALWGWIKGHFSDDSVRSRQIEAFEQAPEAHHDELANMLKPVMQHDENFMKTIRPMLEELRELLPQIKPTGKSQVAIATDHSIIIQQQGDGNSAQIGGNGV